MYSLKPNIVFNLGILALNSCWTTFIDRPVGRVFIFSRIRGNFFLQMENHRFSGDFVALAKTSKEYV